MSVFPEQALIDGIDPVTATYQQIDRYLILLDNTPRVVSPTIDTTNNVLTTSVANTLVTGCRVRVSSSGVLPNLFGGVPIDTQRDYYVRAITTTTFTLHLTLGAAQGNSLILDFISAGTGTLTITEQAFAAKDSKAAIISRELLHPRYSRYLVEQLDGATIIEGRAKRGPIFWQQRAETGDPSLVAGWVVMLGSASSTIRNTTGTIELVKAITLTVLPNSIEALSLNLVAY